MENQLSKQPENVLGTTKFKNLNNENPATELLRFLDGLCFKLNLPALEEGQVVYIAKFLVKEFKWATIDDIDEAIIKAKAGKLKGLNASDYNKLTIDYLGRVLVAYRLFKADLHKSKGTSIDFTTKSIECVENKPKIAYENVLDVFLDEKQGGVNNFPNIMLADWTNCYDYLLNEKGLVELSLEDKIEFAEIVRYDMEAEMKEKRVDEKSLEWKIKMNNATSKYAVGAECVRRLVKGWFLSNIDKL